MKVYMIHPWTKDVESFLAGLGLKGKVDPSSLEWNASAPDILFASEWIYYRKDCYRQFCELYQRAGLVVGILREAVEPDWNLFDLAFSFSNQYEGNPRHVRLPAPQDMFDGFVSRKVNDILTPEQASEVLGGKTAFCNFLYSNPEAHPMRDRLFHALCAYRKVDSLGKHLNNVDVPGTGYGGGNAARCVDIKSPYKFSIASENACMRGYTSEKLYTSLEAHTVPVYWGNPDVCEDVNPAAIVNASDFAGLDQLVERIRQIDSDDALWMEMVSQPWQTREQEEAHARRTAHYHEALTSILKGEGRRAINEGYHPSLYRRHAVGGEFALDRTLAMKFRSRLAGILKK